jgi:hypothetical protein
MVKRNDAVASLEFSLRNRLPPSFYKKSDIDWTKPFSETFITVITALRSAGLAYAIGGLMAYGLYARSRVTDNITIFALPEARRQIDRAFADLGFPRTQQSERRFHFDDAASGVCIRFRLDDAAPVPPAIETAADYTIFGIRTSVFTAEYLLWLYCGSEQWKHRAIVVEMIKAGRVNVEATRLLIEASGKTERLDRLLWSVGQAEEELRRASGTGDVPQPV